MTPTLETTDPALLEFAADVGDVGPVTIEGGRTRWSTGGEADGSTRLLRAPAGIVEHLPEEMIVTVRAGTPVADLHAHLAEGGQRSALPERGGTVGGAIAVGESDYRILSRGSIRNAVLQVRYVSAEGKLVTGGGPTVKNVTGFDLPRLMTGSLGTLGCLAEFMLRTNPIPPVRRWYTATGVDPFVAHKAVLRPAAVLWDGTTTWVLIEGHEPDVDQQAIALGTIGRFSRTDGPPAPSGHRWSLRPSDLQNMERFDTGEFVALIGVGTVFATRAQERSLDDRLQPLHDRIKSEFDPSGRLNPGRDSATR